MSGMQRASDLLALPVLDNYGREVGAVKEVLVNLARGRLAALVVPGKTAEPMLAPADNALVGSERVRLGQGSLLRGEDAAKVREENLTLEQIRKLTVFNCSGNRLGKIQDIILDGVRIDALELSDGLIQDVFQGRDTVELDGDICFQEDKIIIPDEARLVQERDSGTWLHDQGF